jgi:hypothetical protein
MRRERGEREADLWLVSTLEEYLTVADPDNTRLRFLSSIGATEISYQMAQDLYKEAQARLARDVSTGDNK